MRTIWIVAALAIGMVACASRTATDEQTASRTQPYTGKKVVKTAAEWQSQLNPESYRVLREHGTERAFTGAYWANKEAGTYSCAGCALPLFDSDTKFKSGTGWPSYYAPIDSSHVGETHDATHGMARVEVHCNRCEGHLGHVFYDGPQPTGLRYCINSASLAFEKRK